MEVKIPCLVLLGVSSKLIGLIFESTIKEELREGVLISSSTDLVGTGVVAGPGGVVSLKKYDGICEKPTGCRFIISSQDTDVQI